MRQETYRFEAAVYNQQVRDRVAEGEKHRFYDDSWADTHYIEMEAESEDAVRAKLLRRYPVAHGFVIEGITQQRG